MDQNWITKVRTIVETVIKKPVDDANLNLFDAGLVDSLSAVNVLVALEENLTLSLDILDFAKREDFTLARISKMTHIAKEKADGHSGKK
jgi:acyl carrier protein